MQSIDVAIVGAGQAGLAMSACLSRLGIDHVLFERGTIAERWKSTTWDSLTMLTPNWMNVLPHGAAAGVAADGFMSRRELVRYLEAYACANGAPVLAGTEVLSVSADGSGYRVLTSAGEWTARALVIATGQCDRPALPALARAGGSSFSLHSSQYRRECDLPAGGVLVVGASSSGVQIADELRECRARRRAVRRQAHQPAAALSGTGHLRLAGAHGHAVPARVGGARPVRRAASAFAAACGPLGRGRRRSRGAPAERCPPGRPPCRLQRQRCRIRRRSRRERLRPRPSSGSACSARSTPSPARRTGQGCGTGWLAIRTPASAPRSLSLAREGDSARSSGRRAFAGRSPGCTCRCSPPTARSTTGTASRPSPASTRSATDFCASAIPTSSAASGPMPSPCHTMSPASFVRPAGRPREVHHDLPIQ